MPLSEYEQRVLEQMERQLTSDDPRLVSTFQGRPTSSLRRYALAGAGALLGLTVLVIGAATSTPLVGVLGFVTMFVSVVLAFSPARRGGPAGVVAPDGTVRPRSGQSARLPSGRGFLTRFEERWDHRRDNPGR